jgi:probable HAF family extracellular repeat protein
MWLSALSFLHAQTLTWLGVLPGGQSSWAGDVSADGTVVVGQSQAPYHAFRWTPTNGVQDLGTLGGNWSEARSVSADGAIIAGMSYTDPYTLCAARWTVGTGWQNLGDLGPAIFTEAFGISGDGVVIAGWAYNHTTLFDRAFRWTEDEGFVDLGNLPGSVWGGAAYAASWDGSVIVGTAITASFQWIPFRWTQETGMVALVQAPGEARSLSANGAVVVGHAATVAGTRPFLWTETAGAVELGTLGFTHGAAEDVSADGTTVVGKLWNTNAPAHAFRWTQEIGMENLNTTYASLLTSGSQLHSALAISLDGRYLVGEGRNGATRRTEAYLLDTWRWGDTNGNGCIDDSDLLNVLFAFGTPGTGLTRHEDINKDGIVDDADLLIVLFNFGQGC